MKVLILGGTGAMGKPLVNIVSGQYPEWQIAVTSRGLHADHANVSYIVGDARDDKFLKDILSTKWDVIVDFMNYNLDEFESRIPLLLDSTDHYIWFSSCRVYADSTSPLTEESPRLLETSVDEAFLSTNRYALRKARQENLLFQSGKNNFTIIRPYITYNDERLQLGILEKEQWLYRLLKGKPLVVSKEMLRHTTTLSFGNDVSLDIAELIGRNSAKGRVFQIAGKDTITWQKVLELYADTISALTSVVPEVYASDTIKAIELLYEGGYNTVYDRNYDRSFNSYKIEAELGRKSCTTPIREGLRRCLINFLKSDRKFRYIDPVYEAYQDLLTDSHSEQSEFESDSDWQKYVKIRGMHISEIDGLEQKIERII